MNKEQKAPPHVVSHEQGAHTQPVPLVSESSRKGRHSGRPHPPKQSAGGEDFAAGAENGGVLKQ